MNILEFYYLKCYAIPCLPMCHSYSVTSEKVHVSQEYAVRLYVELKAVNAEYRTIRELDKCRYHRSVHMPVGIQTASCSEAPGKALLAALVVMWHLRPGTTFGDVLKFTSSGTMLFSYVLQYHVTYDPPFVCSPTLLDNPGF